MSFKNKIFNFISLRNQQILVMIHKTIGRANSFKVYFFSTLKVFSFFLKRKIVVFFSLKKKYNYFKEKQFKRYLDCLNFLSIRSNIYNTKSILYKEILFSYNLKKRIKENISSKYFPFWLRTQTNMSKNLNFIQTRVFGRCLGTDSNLFLISPTGSGKTIIGIFCIMRVFVNSINFEKSWIFEKKIIKILYIVPIKTIIKEKIVFFKFFFNYFEIKINELSGDFVSDNQKLIFSNVLVATPEKIDILTRKKDKRNVLTRIKVFIIDEIHLLQEERGFVLEQLILRFFLNYFRKISNRRVIALSANFSNYRDLSFFLLANETRNVYYFSEIFRTTPINYLLIGFKNKKSHIRKTEMFNQILSNKILNVLCIKFSSKILIFVHNRKDTLKTAIYLSKNFMKYSALNFRSKFTEKLKKFFIFKLQEKISRRLIHKGIGVHHPGLSENDKKIVEILFLFKIIQILVTTSTLAWGINLPVTHVIIKGTKIYCPKKASWVKISNLNIIQMLSRVGKIVFNFQNEGILITSYKYFFHYKDMFRQNNSIGSNLVFFLLDVINVEFAQSNIKTILDAKKWLINSFMWIRMCRILLKSRKHPTQHTILLLNDLVTFQVISELMFVNMLKYDYKKKIIYGTVFGYTASKYGINYKTILMIVRNLLPNFSQSELLELFSFSSEFSNFYIHKNEEKELHRLSFICIFPIRKISNPVAFKINVLIQAYIANFRINHNFLSAGLVYISKVGGRFFRLLFEIALKKRWANIVFSSLEIYQFIKIRSVSQKFLYLSELNFKICEKFRLITTKSRKIKLTKFYQKKKFFVFSSLNLQPIGKNIIKISLLVSRKLISKNTNKLWFFIEDRTTDLIIMYQYTSIGHKKKIFQILIDNFIFLPISPCFLYFFLKLIVDDGAGSVCDILIDLTKIIFPQDYSLLTEFLNLKHTVNFRLFAGFQGGSVLNEYFLSNFRLLPIFFNQNLNYIIKNTKNKLLFLSEKNLKKIYTELSSLSFFFSDKNYSFLLFSIGKKGVKLFASDLNKCMFAALGVSSKNTNEQSFQIYSRAAFCDKRLFYTTKVCDLHPDNIIEREKNHHCVFIIENTDLIKKLKFSSQIEIFLNEVKINYSKRKFIAISLFYPNNAAFVSWLFCCNIMTISFFRKKSTISNQINSFIFFRRKISDSRFGNFHHRKIKIKSIFFLKKNKYVNSSVVKLLAKFFKYFYLKIGIKILQCTSFIFVYTKINRLLLNFKFGIINEHQKFLEKRLTNEFFRREYLVFLLLVKEFLCNICTERMSFFVYFQVKYFLNFANTDIILFFTKIKSVLFCFMMKNKTQKFGIFQNMPVESKLNIFLIEVSLIFIANKNKPSLLKISVVLFSSFFSFRINQNPNYYGFVCKFSTRQLVRKIIAPMFGKIDDYGYTNNSQYNWHKLCRKGILLMYSFLSEVFFKKIFLKKTGNNIMKICIGIGATLFESEIINLKRGHWDVVKLFKYFLIRHKLSLNSKNLQKSNTIIFEKIYHWIALVANIFKFRVFFLMSIFKKKTLNFRAIGQCNIDYQKSSDKTDVFSRNIFYAFLRKFKMKITNVYRSCQFFNILSTDASEFIYLEKFIFLYLKKTKKKIKLKYKIKLPPVFFKYKKISILTINGHFFYIIIGNKYSDKIFFWKKIFFLQTKINCFEITIQKKTQIIKIVILNSFFYFLDKKFNILQNGDRLKKSDSLFIFK